MKYSELPSGTPTLDDIATWLDNADLTTKRSTLQAIRDLFNSTFNPPQGYLINGKIVPSVSSNNITVALKTLAGNDPSASDPVLCRIGDSFRVITSALSVTKNAGINYFNSAGSELAGLPVDYFVYLGYDVTDGVVIGFARIPGARRYADFSTTNTNEKYCAISTITNATGNDYYEVVGRFEATLSSVTFNWSVPTFTPDNLVQKPIYETRFLAFAPVVTGYSANPTATYYMYKIVGKTLYVKIREGTAGTSNATTTTYTIPFTETGVARWTAPSWIVDNGATPAAPGLAQIATSVNVVTMYKDYNSGAWTASGTKRIQDCTITMEI